MKRPYLVIGIVAVFVGAAAISATELARMRHHGASAPRYIGATPPPGVRAAAFTLRSYRGRRVSMVAERGKVVVLTFIDSGCVDQCPPIAYDIGRAMPRLTPAERARAVALAISVDPRVDTPHNVRTFLRDRRALGALDFLVGPVRGLFGAWKAYHVLSAVASHDANVHSADVEIYNPQGVWVSSLDLGVDLTPASLVHDVRAALRDRRAS